MSRHASILARPRDALLGSASKVRKGNSFSDRFLARWTLNRGRCPGLEFANAFGVDESTNCGAALPQKYLLRPRSGLNDNSPALKRWGNPIDPFGVREADG